MWDPLLVPGQLALLSAPQRPLTGFLQELTHFAVHGRPGDVLWCDGGHTFHPDHFAELNLTRGREADEGALRVLVKRCMTPFQWDSTLSQHLEQRLESNPAAAVLVNPFDGLWTHEEIQDWEQEDYTRFSVQHLKAVARRRNVPILLGVDMDRWWRTHPTLARITSEAVDARWTVTTPDGRWRAVRHDGAELDPYLRRQVTLADFLPAEERVAVHVPQRRRKEPWQPKDGRPFRTRILHPFA